jgi:ATP-dependent Clp protease ATP-binding subunit ClpC
VLFDEIEKAHPDVFNILLQIMEDGQLTDSYGRHVDFKNTIVIMTSNGGAKMIQKRSHLGFHQESDELRHQNMTERVTGELKRVFNPEFLNRVDEVITFHELSLDHIQAIVDIMIREMNGQLLDRDLTIILSDEARTWLSENGYDPVYGARPLRRLIQRSIEDMLAEEILSGRLSGEHTVQIICQTDDTLGYVLVNDGEFVLQEMLVS